MENREKSPRVVVIDRREDHGVLLTRRTAGRYGAEACLRLPATYRKIGEEAFKGNIKSGWNCRIQYWSLGNMHFSIAMH